MIRAAGEFFDTTDVGLIEDVLSRRYADLRIDAHGRPGGLRTSRSALGPSIQLDHNQWALTFDITAGTPLDTLAIGYLRDGQASYRSDGRERRYGPGDVFLALSPEHPYTAAIANADIEVAVLDPALPSRMAGPAPARVQPPVRFTGYEPVSAQAAQTWKTTSTYVRDMLSAPGISAQPLLLGNLAQLLAAIALTVFPNSALTDPTSQDRNDAHPETLRRTRAFIDEHAHEDITVTDIAAAGRVSVRAVQLAFRRHLSITPMQYLRRVRLEAAHHDLVVANSASTTVTAVAYRWGFANASRFAASYRAAYGVVPGQTLRRD